VPRKTAAIADPNATSLVVHLHRDADLCTASFDGSLTNTTRLTIEGLVDLLAGEESVILDLSKVDVIDNDGSDAVEALIDSIRARGAHLLVDHPPGLLQNVSADGR
jgi:anti-anti-sigma regulatory factor